ncbi:hypothetical protein QOT17_018634 [Balamuthia mandrillaris]
MLPTTNSNSNSNKQEFYSVNKQGCYLPPEDRRQTAKDNCGSSSGSTGGKWRRERSGGRRRLIGERECCLQVLWERVQFFLNGVVDNKHYAVALKAKDIQLEESRAHEQQLRQMVEILRRCVEEQDRELKEKQAIIDSQQLINQRLEEELDKQLDILKQHEERFVALEQQMALQQAATAVRRSGGGSGDHVDRSKEKEVAEAREEEEEEESGEPAAEQEERLLSRLLRRVWEKKLQEQASTAQSAAHYSNEEHKWQQQLMLLEEMGFRDKAQNVALLNKHRGSLQQVIGALV